MSCVERHAEATSLPTAALVGRAQEGCAASFDEVVRRLEPRLLGFLGRFALGRGEAEDVAQETFLRAWASIGRYDDRWAFSTWLFTIARRLAMQRRRDEAARADRLAARAPAERALSGGSALDELAHRDGVSILAAAIDEVLPESQRLVIHLRYAEGMEIGAIAKALGRTRVSVRVSLHRARSALVERLAGAEFDEARVARSNGRAARANEFHKSGGRASGARSAPVQRVTP